MNLETNLGNPMTQVETSGQNPQSQPEEFDEWNDSHSKDQTQESSNGWKEINPGHVELTSHQNDRRLLIEDLDHRDVFVEGVVQFGFELERIRLVVNVPLSTSHMLQ